MSNNRLMTKREYAATLGLAQPNSRGRLSREAHEAIQQAIDCGVEFVDSIASSSQPRKRQIETTAPVMDYDGPTYRVQQRKATRYWVTLPNGKHKSLSERTACICGASLLYCGCRTPMVPTSIVHPENGNTEDMSKVEHNG